MKRLDFIENFNLQFKNSEFNYAFDIDILEYDNKNQFKNALNKKFDFFLDNEKLSLETLNSLIEKNYDDCYEEDEPDSPWCRYNCKINLHELYDAVILNSENALDTAIIYRVENSFEQGLYSGFFASHPINPENQPNPMVDKNFKGIFDEDFRYKTPYTEQWYFGFNSLKEVKNWLQKEDIFEKLNQNGFKVKKIWIPQNFVIQGNQQLIFKKNQTIWKYSLNWQDLKDKINNPHLIV